MNRAEREHSGLEIGDGGQFKQGLFTVQSTAQESEKKHVCRALAATRATRFGHKSQWPGFYESSFQVRV